MKLSLSIAHARTNIASLISLFVLTLLLNACSSGDGDSGPSSQQGVFLDSAVSGLSYSSGSLSGTTGADGAFLYEQGGTVTFKIGDIVVGTANGQAVMTPVSLVSGATNETDPTVVNIVQFLLTIDDDSNPTNGIQITATQSATATGQSIDFTSASFDTDTNLLNVIALLTPGTTLVSELDAQAHLKDTLFTAIAGIYNGTYSGDDGGTWSVTASTGGIITGSGCDTSSQTVFSIGGTVGTDGASVLGFTDGGIGSYSGNFSLTGTFSGTWTESGNAGTFTGAKASSASGGSC